MRWGLLLEGCIQRAREIGMMTTKTMMTTKNGRAQRGAGIGEEIRARPGGDESRRMLLRSRSIPAIQVCPKMNCRNSHK